MAINKPGDRGGHSNLPSSTNPSVRENCVQIITNFSSVMWCCTVLLKPYLIKVFIYCCLYCREYLIPQHHISLMSNWNMVHSMYCLIYLPKCSVFLDVVYVSVVCSEDFHQTIIYSYIYWRYHSLRKLLHPKKLGIESYFFYFNSLHLSSQNSFRRSKWSLFSSCTNLNFVWMKLNSFQNSA